MGFMIGLVALVAAYFTWHFRYTDVTFDTYIKAKLGFVGARWKEVLWGGVAFALWSLITFRPEPAYVGLLIIAGIWVVWISSDAGQKWLKDLTK